MHVYRSIWLFVLLIDQPSLGWIDPVELLENQRIDDQLRLLGPEFLLKNRHKNADRIVNHACDRDLMLYKRALKQRKLWAIKILDASSKLPVGILQGHVVDVGMYDECVEAHGQLDNIEIQGKHCMYAFQPTLKTPFFITPKLSICLPASCDAEDVLGFLHDTIHATEALKDLGMKAVSASCTDSSPKRITTALVIILIIGLVHISFLVFCTICDIKNRKLGKITSGLSSTLERFSLLKNAEAIFSTKVSNSDLPVVHGLRAISCCWIVLMHEYVLPMLGVYVNVIDITKWFLSWNSMLVIIGLFCVDIFFALSGFLMTHNFFKRIRKTKEFNVPLYYLHRYIRLTPPVVVIMVLTLVVDVGSGPRWEWMKNVFTTTCSTKWWSILLYFQNFFEKDNYCLLHLWTLSVDMQLYWLSPFILYPLYKRPKFGLTLLLILIIASAFASGAIVGTNKYSALYFPHDFNITKYMEVSENLYIMTHVRASPWLIGVLFAYMIACESTAPTKVFITIGWTLAIASFALCVFGTRYLTHINYEYHLVQEIIFATLQRPLWTFGICWIIYASIHNSAGPISSLLSAKIFLPISRLSYSIYMVHAVFLGVEIGILRAPKYFKQYFIIQSFITNTLISIVFALTLNIAVEAPIFILEDIITKKFQINRREIQKIK